MVERDKDFLDVQGGVEVFPQFGYKGIPVVRGCRHREAIPCHPGM